MNLDGSFDLSNMELAVTGVENLTGSDPIVILKATGTLSGSFAVRPSLGNWAVCVNGVRGEVSFIRGGTTILFR
jgi:hypothetical protein